MLGPPGAGLLRREASQQKAPPVLKQSKKSLHRGEAPRRSPASASSNRTNSKLELEVPSLEGRFSTKAEHCGEDAPASARAAVQAGGQRDGGMPAASDVPGHRAAPPLQEAAGGTRASGAPGPAPEPRAPAPAPRSRPARWGKPKTPRRPPPAPFRIDARQPKRAGASPDGGS
ncbi:unnamed protein product [Rangifer tarandus platyrhynchus]|uniref:Uncharacterized protein n=1 Tax=Rangifer tarandus platyrhynchus TaxID=3082113 RepID=A0ABN8ZHJ3_RANTA|nr:unnamed protein product [Rangifer tarandus platyrhynchus]